MLKIFKVIGLVIFTSVITRAISLFLQFNFFVPESVNFWELLFSRPFWKVLPKITHFNQNTISVLIIAPVLEGIILMCMIFCALKLKFPKLLIVLLITIFAYFVHKPVAEGFYSYQASIGFCTMTILYLYLLKKSQSSHVYAYCITTLTHASYNFIGLYLLTAYALSGLIT